MASALKRKLKRAKTYCWRHKPRGNRLYVEYERQGRVERVGFWILPPLPGQKPHEVAVDGGDSRYSPRRIYILSPLSLPIQDFIRWFRINVDFRAPIRRIYIATLDGKVRHRFRLRRKVKPATLKTSVHSYRLEREASLYQPRWRSA